MECEASFNPEEAAQIAAAHRRLGLPTISMSVQKLALMGAGIVLGISSDMDPSNTIMASRMIRSLTIAVSFLAGMAADRLTS